MRDIKVFFAGEHESTVDAAHEAQWKQMAREKLESAAKLAEINTSYEYRYSSGSEINVLAKAKFRAHGFGDRYDGYAHIPSQQTCFLADLIAGLYRVSGDVGGTIDRRVIRRFLIGGPLYKIHLVLKTDDPLTAQVKVEDLLFKLDAAYAREIRQLFGIGVEIVQSYKPPAQLHLLEGAS